MTDAKQAWSAWRALVIAEAKDLELAADALDASLLTRYGYHQLRTDGREAFDSAETTILALKAQRVLTIRARAKARRELAKIAMWLGDPKRRDALIIAAKITREKQQNDRRLTKVMDNSFDRRDLWRPWKHLMDSMPQQNARIDRIVAGARLYAATLDGGS